MDITVVIPTIAPRAAMLARAVASVEAQTLRPARVLVVEDVDREGAPCTRDRGLQQVDTEFVAFLDDDDTLLPCHLDRLAWCAKVMEADYCYPWFYVDGGQDPFPQFFGRPWDNARPHQTTITTLVRTDVAQKVGFHPPDEGRLVDGQRYGEDYAFTIECMEAGAKIVHLPERTWRWRHHSGNTSGRPDRW